MKSSILKKHVKTVALLSTVVVSFSACNGNGVGGGRSLAPDNTEIQIKAQKLADAKGTELTRFYAAQGYKIDFADSLLVGPQFYAAESNKRPNTLYNLKVLKVADNAFTTVYEANVVCGSSYEGCKVNIDKSKLPADEYALELSQDGKIIAGGLFYVSSATDSTNLILDATSTGTFLKRTYLGPQMMNSSDEIDEQLIKDAFDKAARNAGYSGKYDLNEMIYFYYNYLLENGTSPATVITQMVNTIKAKAVSIPVSQSIAAYQASIARILELSNKASFAQMAEKIKSLTESIKKSGNAQTVLDALVSFASGGSIKDVSDKIGKLSDVMDFLAEIQGSKNALAEMNALITALKQIQAAELSKDDQINNYLKSISDQLQKTDVKAEIRMLQNNINTINVTANVLRNTLGSLDLDSYIYKNTEVSPKLSFDQLTILYAVNTGDGIFNAKSLREIQTSVDQIVMDKALTNVDEFLKSVDYLYDEKAKDGVNIIPLRRAHNLILSDYSLELQAVLADAELIQKNALFLEYKYPYYKGKVAPTEKLDSACNQGTEEEKYNCKFKDISSRYKSYRNFITNKFKTHYINVYQDIYGAERLQVPSDKYKNMACNLLSLTYEGKAADGQRIVKTIGASCLNGAGQEVSSILDVKKDDCDYTSAITTSLLNIDGKLSCKSTANKLKTENSIEHGYPLYGYIETYDDKGKEWFLSHDGNKELPVNFVVYGAGNERTTTADDFINGIGVTTPGANIGETLDLNFKARNLGIVNINTLGMQSAWRLSYLKEITAGGRAEFYVPITLNINGAYFPFYLKTEMNGSMQPNGYNVRSVGFKLACMTNNCQFETSKHVSYDVISIKGSRDGVRITLDYCGSGSSISQTIKSLIPVDNGRNSGSICFYTRKL